jgi:hypothetical protein
MTTTTTIMAFLDQLAPLAMDLPTSRQERIAYALGMLAADMTAHPPSNHLLAICAHEGLAPQEAEQLARGLACLIVRVTQLVIQE